MRWISFLILAYVSLGLQTGLARAIEWHSASPDFVLLAVIFLALNAPRDAALLACFILGLLRDLSGDGTLGLFALSYGAIGVIIVGIQQAVHRKHPVTHSVLALFGGIVVAFILSLHGWIRPSEPGAHPHVGPYFSSAVYSAILAPIILAFLDKAVPLFRFQTARGRI
jgi:rod shape-determining protein MreD